MGVTAAARIRRALEDAIVALERLTEDFLRLEEEDPGIASWWQGFLVRVREVRVLNEANGLAIRRSQALLGAELNLLRGAVPDATLYDAAGGSGHVAQGRIIASA